MDKTLNQKLITIFVLPFLLSLLLSNVYASPEPTEIKINSPYQVVPGTSVPIYVTVKHFGGTQAIQAIDTTTLSTQIKTLESASQSDTVTVNAIEIFSPQSPNAAITASSLAQMQPVKAQVVNKNLVSIAGAIQTKEQLEVFYLKKLQEIEQANLTDEEKTQKLNALFSEYQTYEISLESIIQNGKYHDVLLLKIQSDFPEGDIQIPVRVTYTKKDGTQETVIKTLTVTVTSIVQPKRAIIIDIDALKRDALENSLSNMYYTRTNITNNGVRFTSAKTVFPSITMAAQAGIFTGNWPKNHRVAGNTWFDKSTLTYRDYWAGTWWDWSLDGQANNDLNPNIQTIYEAANSKGMRSTVIFNQYARGVDTTPIIGDWVRPGIDEYGWKFVHEYYKIDQNAMHHALEELEDFPDILTIYFPGFDGHSHYFGPQEQENYLKTYIDEEIRKLLFGACYWGGLDCHKGILELKADGATTLYDETIIVITADHGQTSVTNDAYAAISKNELASVLSAAGYWPDTLIANQYADTVIALNGGMAQLYIQNGLNLGDNDYNDGTWSALPTWSDVKTAAQAFAYKDKALLLDYGYDFVDFILVRWDTSNGYRVYQDGGTTVSLETFFAGKESQYPDAIERIKGLDSQRSGDIILVANYSHEDGYANYFGDDPEAGTHGSLNSNDAYIPLVFSGPTIRKGETDSTSARNIDMAPTLANLLGFSMPNADGVVLDVKSPPPDTTPPAQPQLLSPADGSTASSKTPAFSWSAASDAESGVDYYQLQVATSIYFSSPVIDVATASTSYTPASPLSNGTYYWRVRAVDKAGNYGAWSSIFGFAIIEQCVDTQAPPAPTLYDPGGTINEGEYLISWSSVSDSGCSGLKQYELQESDSPTFQTTIYYTTQTSYLIAGKGSGTYYYRVRAIDNAGNAGSFSNVVGMTVEKGGRST